MLHIPYTICRLGTYYYNGRVPKRAVKAYGSFIRQTLSKCPDEAAAYSKRLSSVFEGSWIGTTEIITPVNIPCLLSSFQPKSLTLQEYFLIMSAPTRPRWLAFRNLWSRNVA